MVSCETFIEYFKFMVVSHETNNQEENDEILFLRILTK